MDGNECSYGATTVGYYMMIKYDNILKLWLYSSYIYMYMVYFFF